MCVAIYLPIGKRVTKEQFDLFAKNNGDGFGLMYVKDEKLEVFKTLNVQEFYDVYTTYCNLYGDKTPMVVHFRKNSVGTTSIDNCHPFKCSDTIGVVHNGTLGGFTNDLIRSDTYIFAERVLQPIAEFLYINPEIQFLLKESIGSNNKLIFLNNKKEHLIFNEEAGMWEDGVWYSTKYIKPYAYERKYEVAHWNKPAANTNTADTDNCIICHKVIKISDTDYIEIMDQSVQSVYVCDKCSKSNVKLRVILKMLEQKTKKTNDLDEMDEREWLSHVHGNMG